MSARDLQILITPGEATLTVSLVGEANFDFDRAGQHIDQILRHKPAAVIVDASQLTFISSIGMCFLLNLRKALQESGGTLRLDKLQPLVRKAMEHAHVIHLFEDRAVK